MRKTPANDDARSAGRLEISDRDLADYVSDRIAPERRATIEGFLACNPDMAARVMSERHRRARGGSARRVPWRSIAAAGVAACLLSGTVGWHAAAQPPVTAGWREADGDSAPRYVEDALESRHAAQVRAAMLSQADSPNLDAVEVERALKVRAPRLPLGWRLIDVQVYPSDDGPALNLVVLTADSRRLNLFAVKADAAVSAAPVLAQKGRETVAYWERGAAAYVLLPDANGGDLLSDALALAGRG